MNTKRNITLILAATLVLGASAAMADKLSDFQEAVRKADATASRTARSEAPATRSRAAYTTTATGDGARLPAAARAWASDDKDKKRLDKEIEQVKKDIDEATKRVAKATTDLRTRKELVDDAIDTLDKCIDYRRAVMNSFAAALDKVRGENDEAIKPLARELRDRYQVSKRGHEMAIQSKQNALDTCKKSRP